MSKETVKTQIDLDITNKTTSKSISPLNVGGNMKAVVDLIPDITSKEDILNKSINIITDNNSDIKYPTTKAVATYVDGLAAESWVNKSINIITDAISDTKYPSVKAVKTYVDANIGGNQDLQSVLDNGNSVSYIDGSNGELFSGIDGNRIVSFTVPDSTGVSFSKLDVYPNNIRIVGNDNIDNFPNEKIGGVAVVNGQVEIEQQINSTHSTIVSFEAPIATGIANLKFPAKIAGIYTLATLEDVSNINTAFIAKTYTSTMSVVHNADQPNFEIHLTGDLNLTLTGTATGDSGVVNLYFPGTETVIINGFKGLKIVGSGETISIFFMHDTDGIKWYNDREESTTIHHIAVATSTGTFSNVGNACTGIGTTITANMIGAKIIKANGEEGIIATRSSDTSFTTEVPFLTNSVDTTFQVKCIATKVDNLGNQFMYTKNGALRLSVEEDGDVLIGEKITITNSGFILNDGALYQQGLVQIWDNGNIKTMLPYYASEAAAIADTDLPSNWGFRVTGSNVHYIKP